MTNEETIQHLNELIAVAIDGENGYSEAAAHAADPHFQTMFAEKAKQRAGHARDLVAEVERLGGVPAKSGTAGAALHRGWLDLKSALSGGAAEAIVAACETGDDTAEAAYERVVNGGISGEPRSVVEKQWEQIKQAHRRLINLKRNAD